MILYSHRGNLETANAKLENSITYIETAISAGFAVEIDLRMIGNDLYLGHDYPQYLVKQEWIHEQKENLLIHVKDFNALSSILKNGYDWHYFCHNNDPFAITSKGLSWLHSIENMPTENTIVPLITYDLVKSYVWTNVYGICSDYIIACKNKFTGLGAESHYPCGSG